MKKSYLLFIMILIALLLSACSLEDLPFLNRTNLNNESYDDGGFEFLVEKVILSKGYQNTQARVELVSKLDENRLLIFPGLVKSSGMEVSDITIEDDLINIVIKNKSYSSSELVIPQISILVTKWDNRKLNDLQYNIINENFEPIKINYGIVDVLNKIQADFKITSDTYPDIDLLQEGDSILWKIDYDNIFDIESKEIPVIDLELLVDSSSGEVLMSKKSLISSLIDEGEILSFDQKHGFLYSKNRFENQIESEELWFYDFLKDSKSKVYTSLSDIISANFRPDGLALAFIEKSEDYSIPYILELKDKRVTKIVLEENQTPKQINWHNNMELSILTSTKSNQSSQSKIIAYNTENNTLRTDLISLSDIVTFSKIGDTVLLSEYLDDTKNNKIRLWTKGKGFTEVSLGYSPQIINENYGAYIKKNENSNMESLHIFNLETLLNDFTISDTVRSFHIISPTEIYITETSDGNSCYKTSLLNIEDRDLMTVGNINSAKSFYQSESEIVYLNLSVPFVENSPKIIFSISKDELKRR